MVLLGTLERAKGTMAPMSLETTETLGQIQQGYFLKVFKLSATHQVM